MIRHILSDGREVESIEGFVIPTTGPTAAVYNIITEFVNNHPGRTQRNEEDKTNATA